MTDQFETLWDDPNARKVIQARSRSPGGQHEWLLVSRANIFKKWGVTAGQIAALRTPVNEIRLINPTGIHGGAGSTQAHNELISLIDGCSSFQEYREALHKWANSRLSGGSAALPGELK